MARKNRK